MLATKPGGIVPVGAGLLAGLHQCVGNVQKLHYPLVQVQVLQTLEQVGVLTPVASVHPDSLGLGFGGKDGQSVVKSGHRCPGLSNSWQRDRGALQGMESATDYVPVWSPTQFYSALARKTLEGSETKMRELLGERVSPIISPITSITKSMNFFYKTQGNRRKK